MYFYEIKNLYLTNNSNILQYPRFIAKSNMVEFHFLLLRRHNVRHDKQKVHLKQYCAM